ncbi:MAG TPA: hypothetical protein VG015_06415, partial [Candidatus Dormibacteraeota bacterium]|nr:hypothetical protein [Candidatus Dormibacteraeota bacterium]
MFLQHNERGVSTVTGLRLVGHSRTAWRATVVLIAGAILLLGGLVQITPTLYTPTAITTFAHPGVLVSQAQLNFMKAQVASKTEPMYSEFLNAQASTYGSLTYTPSGPPSGGIIDCGSFSNPDIGCSSEDEDGSAAYTQALLYWITGTSTYAQNAITILNAYG